MFVPSVLTPKPVSTSLHAPAPTFEVSTSAFLHVEPPPGPGCTHRVHSPPLFPCRKALHLHLQPHQLGSPAPRPVQRRSPCVPLGQAALPAHTPHVCLRAVKPVHLSVPKPAVAPSLRVPLTLLQSCWAAPPGCLGGPGEDGPPTPSGLAGAPPSTDLRSQCLPRS